MLQIECDCSTEKSHHHRSSASKRPPSWTSARSTRAAQQPRIRSWNKEHHSRCRMENHARWLEEKRAQGHGAGCCQRISINGGARRGSEDNQACFLGSSKETRRVRLARMGRHKRPQSAAVLSPSGRKPLATPKFLGKLVLQDKRLGQAIMTVSKNPPVAVQPTGQSPEPAIWNLQRLARPPESLRMLRRFLRAFRRSGALS